MAHLPYELLCEILSRLPIKSIVRFSCICRTWYALLRDPFFIDLQLAHSNQNPCYTPIAFLEKSSSPCDGIFHTRLSLIYHDNHDLDVSIPGFKLLIDGFTCLSSCHGLLCLTRLKYLTVSPYIIYNPITKQYFYLPFCLPEQSHYDSQGRRMMTCAFGIGFDAATKQYKVVKIMGVCWRGILVDHEAEIWTLGCSTSWRYMGKIPYSTSPPLKTIAGFFIQGAIHWWMDFERTAIVSMDMGSEKFCAIDMPFKSDDSTQMMGWNGCLAAVEHGDSNHGYCFNIWVLKDYPCKESWSKELSIEWNHENLMPHPHLKYRYSLLCIKNNGDILVLDVEKLRLVSYNKEERSFTCIRPLPPAFCYIGHALSYVPSLVGWKQEVKKKRRRDQYNAERNTYC